MEVALIAEVSSCSKSITQQLLFCCEGGGQKIALSAEVSSCSESITQRLLFCCEGFFAYRKKTIAEKSLMVSS